MGSATRFLMLLTTTSPSPLLHHRCPALLRLACQRLQTSLSSISHRHYLHRLHSSSPFKIKASRQFHTPTASSQFQDYPSAAQPPRVPHPWPEWSNFIDNLSTAGYFSRMQGFDTPNDGFVSVTGLPEDFLRAASASLGFAHDRAFLLEKLSRRDIQIVVENGAPILFKNGEESVRRLSLFLGEGNNGVLTSDSEHMVDLMRILLSYASNPVSPEKNNLQNREFVECSVRNLLSELAHLSYVAPEANLSGSVQNQFLERHGQMSRPLGQNIEMKRGDWICPRCCFMNFARNVKCLECEEARPKRQLTGGEWECPQCDFFNYGRNMVCLRCDCKRPGEVPLGTISGSGLGYHGENYARKPDVDSRLAENEEKAQRWFSKISQLDSSSDMSSAIEDEDFPEIMPLRKGVNRFVVSTRKTPLERRLANAQYQRNSSNDGTFGGNDLQSSGTNIQRATRTLDEIIGKKLATSESVKGAVSSEQNAGADATYSNSVPQQYGAPRGSDSNYTPFVPLPADRFAKKHENVKTDVVGTDNYKPFSSRVGEPPARFSLSSEFDQTGENWHPSENNLNQALSNDKEKEQTEQSGTWFKRVAELHNVTDATTEISDEEFPEMMPMRKGENRFVVSKNKDRSLTSPIYKRRMAMEQANSTNYVPFVPFPPNHFAKKDNADGASLTNKAIDETSNSVSPDGILGSVDDAGARMPKTAEVPGSSNLRFSGEKNNQIKTDASSELPTSTNSAKSVTDSKLNTVESQSSGYSWNANIRGTTNLMGSSHQNSIDPQENGRNIGSGSYPRKEDISKTGSSTGTVQQSSENQNTRDSWRGKSLEGSLVKEPDPLDMSEEAKAERWFRRVAQIKDISELSQIPDEDFPSIMPMRKGVNRFVVSKRKTPLERRLTSTQYRRNLPTVKSDPPPPKESDSS